MKPTIVYILRLITLSLRLCFIGKPNIALFENSLTSFQIQFL